MNKLFHLLVILLIISSIQLYSQTGSVNGYVYFKQTGEPALFTNVYLKGTTYGATTNQDGYFAITNVPSGDYKIVATFLGYDTAMKDVSIKKNQVITHKLYLNQLNITLQTIDISAKAENFKNKTEVSIIKATPKDIYEIPSIGGQPDIAQYLQIVPGVTSTGDQGGQLYIRGGSPIENKVLLDHMIVYSPFHSIGLSSVFDTDIISNIDIYTGGFNANYGGRLSSLIKIDTRSGNKNKLKGKLDVNTFGSKILIEGPFKQKEKRENSNTFILSYKKGYLKDSYDMLYSNIGIDNGLPFTYDDLYGKLSFMGKSGNKLDLFGFHFTDQVEYPFTQYNWDNSGGGTNMNFVPSNSTSIINLHAAYSIYNMNNTDPLGMANSSSVANFNSGINILNFVGSNEINYGMELMGNKTEFIYHNTETTITDIGDNSSEACMYLNGKFTLGNLITNPGLRMHYYGSLPLKRASLEPRLSMKYLITDYLALKLATGIYSQNLISSKDPNDITNYFYGILAINEDFPDEFKGKEVEYYQQKASHLIGGFEILVNRNFNLNTEFYYKDYIQLASYNREKLYPNTADYKEFPAETKETFLAEDGYAKGFDINTKYRYKKAQVQIVYSYGITKRSNDKESYYPVFDRRHNLNALNTYTWGKDDSWGLSLRWNLASGFPFNKSEGVIPIANFKNAHVDDPNSYYVDRIKLAHSDETGRFPYYHRLDVSIKRKLKINTFNLETQIGATNIYNRNNLFYINPVNAEKTYQLPFMVNFGISISN